MMYLVYSFDVCISISWYCLFRKNTVQHQYIFFSLMFPFVLLNYYVLGGLNSITAEIYFNHHFVCIYVL